jgi:hypothetical protein
VKAAKVILIPRLRLRRPQDSDAQAIFSTYANDVEVTRFLSWPRHLSLDDTQRFLNFSANNTARTYLKLTADLDAVICKHQEKSFLGKSARFFQSEKDFSLWSK